MHQGTGRLAAYGTVETCHTIYTVVDIQYVCASISGQYFKEQEEC